MNQSSIDLQQMQEAALVAHAKGDLTAAVRLYRKLLNTGCAPPNIRRFFGSALAQQGNLEESLRVWDVLFALSEYEADVSFIRDFARAGFQAQSKKALAKARRFCSSNLENPTFQALCKAIEVLNPCKSSSISPWSSLCSEKQLSVLDEIENVAGTDSLPGLFKTTDQEALRISIAQRLFLREKYTEVLTLLDSVTGTQNEMLIYFYLKSINVLGLYKRLNAFVEESPRVLREHADSAYEVLLGLERQGKPEEALKFIQTISPLAISKLDQDVDFINLKGLLLAQCSRDDEAILTFKRALALDTNHRDSRRNLKNLFLTRHQFDEALVLDDAYQHRVQDYDAIFSASTNVLHHSEFPILLDEGLGEQILFRTVILQFLNFKKESMRFVCNPRVDALFSDGALPPPEAHERPTLRGGTLAIGLIRNALKTGVISQQIPTLRPRHMKYIGISWKSQNPYIGHSKSVPLTGILQEAKKFRTHQFVLLQPLSVEETAVLSQHGSPNIIYDKSIEGNSLLPIRSLALACDHVITVSNTVAHVVGSSKVSATLIQRPGRSQLWFWVGLFRGESNRHLIYNTVSSCGTSFFSLDSPFIQTALNHEQ